MRYCLAAGLLVIIAFMLVAGCVLDTVPGEVGTPGTVTTTVSVTVPPGVVSLPSVSQATVEPVNTSTTQPVETTPLLSLGDHYLQRAYAFSGGSTSYTDQVRVNDPSWGITMSILPLKDDPKDCWFEMTVTNIDTGLTKTFGYGQKYSYDTYQQYPMYTTGAYRITMVGDLVRVDLNVAKRLP
ncbi:MAG: hypothetical protein WC342_00025 [Methanoregula sp.]|jgi:hypothetical protein